MSKVINKILKFIVICMITIGIYFLLLALTSLIPSKWIEKNVTTSSEQLEKIR